MIIESLDVHVSIQVYEVREKEQLIFSFHPSICMYRSHKYFLIIELALPLRKCLYVANVKKKKKANMIRSLGVFFCVAFFSRRIIKKSKLILASFSFFFFFYFLVDCDRKDVAGKEKQSLIYLFCFFPSLIHIFALKHRDKRDRLR